MSTPPTLRPSARMAARALRRASAGLAGGVERLLDRVTDEGSVDSAVTRPVRPLTPAEGHGFVGRLLITVGTLLVGFAVFVTGVTPVMYVRDQQLLGEQLRFDLANSTAPTGQQGADGSLLPLGTPVALIEAPSISLRSVVVEGTTSTALQSGPGHRRDTVLPGQPGASVILGRQSAFGGPFAALSGLRTGDVITTTTGLGTAEYEVVGVRLGVEELPERPDAPGSLTLVSTVGLPFLAAEVVRVDAVLRSSPHPATARAFTYAALPADELALASDLRSLAETVLAGVLLLAVAVALTVSRRRWGRWQTWVVGAPLLAASAVLLYDHAVTLLPNLL